MNILMIAYHFPPDSTSGSFRSLYFARYLEKMGEDVCILTAREQDYMPYQVKDYSLLGDLTDRVDIVGTRVFQPHRAIISLRDRLLRKTKTEAKTVRSGFDTSSIEDSSSVQTSPIQKFKDTITDLLTTPDAEVGWLLPAVREGLRISKIKKPEVMYATGRPWTCFLIGAILKRLTGIPLVLDFRDPWVANPVFLIKSQLIRSIESFMERKVIALADHIITNTEEVRQDFLHRYPMLTANKLTTIPNGFEGYARPYKYKNKAFTLTHTGSLLFRSPQFLLQAVINLVEKHVIPEEDIHIVLLGDTSLHSVKDPALKSVLQHPLLQNVLEVLPRLPYHDTLQYQQRSEVLVLMQPNHFSLQVPRKLYDYLTFRKPILGITSLDGATARIIRENDLGIVTENRTSEIEPALQNFYEKWKNNSLIPPSMDKCDKFMNKNLTVELLKIFREYGGGGDF